MPAAPLHELLEKRLKKKPAPPEEKKEEPKKGKPKGLAAFIEEETKKAAPPVVVEKIAVPPPIIPPAKPAAKPRIEIPFLDMRKLEDVPEKEKNALRYKLVEMSVPELKGLAAKMPEQHWYRKLAETIVSEKEGVALPAALPVPPPVLPPITIPILPPAPVVIAPPEEEEIPEELKPKEPLVKVPLEKVEKPPEVEEALKKIEKRDRPKLIFSIAGFEKKPEAMKKALVLKMLDTDIDAKALRTYYESNAFTLQDMRDFFNFTKAYAIGDRYLDKARGTMSKALMDYIEGYELGKRTLEAVAQAETQREEIEKLSKEPTTEEKEAMVGLIGAMKDEDLKAAYEQSKKDASLLKWQKAMVRKEVFRRGLVPEVEITQVNLDPEAPPAPIPYESLLDKFGNLHRSRYDKFIRNWGLEPVSAVAEWVWDYVQRKEKIPDWGEIPADLRHEIDISYRAHLREKYKDEIAKMVEKGLTHSPDEFAGLMWKEYGRQWTPIPMYKLGVVKVVYPGGMSKDEWFDYFKSVLMKEPYKLGLKRVHELYTSFGILGKMPPLDEVAGKLPTEVVEAAKRGTDPTDSYAVLGFYKKEDRPLNEADLMTLFDNDDARVRKVQETMFEYTEPYFKGAVQTAIKEISQTPEGNEKLADIAITANKRILADMIKEKVPNFRPDAPGYIDLAYGVLLENVPRTDFALQYYDFVTRTPKESVNSIRKKLQLEVMEKILPKWGNVQVTRAQKGVIARWDALKEELGRTVTALDYFMRYPDVTMMQAREVEEAVNANMLDTVYGSDKLKDPERILKEAKKELLAIEGFKPGDNKSDLLKRIYSLERLNDRYRLLTDGEEMVKKFNVGPLKLLDYADAKSYATGEFRDEWVLPEDFLLIENYIKEKKRLPFEADLKAMFPDVEKANYLKWELGKKLIPEGIKLSDETIKAIAEAKGLTGPEVEEAVMAFRSKREWPLTAAGRKRLQGMEEKAKAMRQLNEIFKRPVPPEVKKRIGEIKTLSGSQASKIQGMQAYLSGLDKDISALNARLDDINRKKKMLVEQRFGGSKEEIAAKKASRDKEVAELEKSLVGMEEKRRNLFASRDAVERELMIFAKTLPRVDYTKGMADIDYDMYLNREVEVSDFKKPEVKKPVGITLTDIYDHWVAPIEKARAKYVEDYGKQPTLQELMAMEPTVESILEEERKTGEAVRAHDKKIGTIVFMNFSRDEGSYPFEYQMAQVGKDFDIKDIPLFAMPAGTPEQRALQFQEWLKFGLTKHEVEGWPHHVRMEFVGDDWTMCDWRGYDEDHPPKSKEDIEGHETDYTKCALKKAKTIQSAALQFIEPEFLQPIIMEMGKAAPKELEELQKENEGLKEELKAKVHQLKETEKLSKEALGLLEKAAAEKAEYEARLEALEEGEKEAKPVIAAKVGPGRPPKRIRAAREMGALRKKAAELEGQIKAIAKKELTAAQEEELLESLKRAEEEPKKRLKEVAKKVERIVEKARDICFLKDEWNTIKISLGEHLASNMARLSEAQKRLSEARGAGLTVDISTYENLLRTLQQEADVLSELTRYVRAEEGKDPGRFLCTQGEMGAVRLMKASQIEREKEERGGA